MEISGHRNVRWTGVTKRPRISFGVNAKNKRKRYATRDQPTWNNCKLPRPSCAYQGDIVNAERGDIEVKEGLIEYDRVPGSRTSATPKSSRLLSARSSFSKATNSWSISTTGSRETARTLGSVGNGIFQESMSKNGRHILIEKTKQMMPAFAVEIQTEKPVSEPSRSQNVDSSKHLRKFRVPSAESTHRSADISIGLRQISRMLSLSSSAQDKEKPTKRSNSLLHAMVTLTSQNLQRNRSGSEPTVPVRPTSPPNESWKELGPGEGDTRGRRRSSTTSATKGEGSIGNNNYTTLKGASHLRPLPPALVSSPFNWHEWRPPSLHKYSVKRPWAPKQQSSRYFPRHANLQDVHCRNPYVVPGSTLYKLLPGDPR